MVDKLLRVTTHRKVVNSHYTIFLQAIPIKQCSRHNEDLDFIRYCVRVYSHLSLAHVLGRRYKCV